MLFVALVTIERAARWPRLKQTYDQLPRTMLALRGCGRAAAAGASVRLDVEPGPQLWVAYMLAGQPLCSQKPLLEH